MGSEYSVVIPHNIRSNFDSKKYRNSIIIGYGSIYKLTENNHYIKNILEKNVNDFHIIGKTKFPFFKHRVRVHLGLTGKELKDKLNSFGVVDKIKDMYVYNCAANTKIFIYDSNTHSKYYDYRYDTYFTFYRYERYDIYIL